MSALRDLTDAQLNARLLKLGRIRSEALVGLVLCLAEVHRRRIHLAAGFSTLAEYCRTVLKEDRRKAWRLGLAAEAVIDFPLARELLEARRLSVTVLVAVKTALTRENHVELLNSAIGMTEDESNVLASLYRPRPRRTDSVRVVHSLEPTFVGKPSESPSPATVELMPLERVEIRMTVTKEVHAQLQHVRSALSHQVPDGNLNDILAECFRLTLIACAKRKLGANVPYVLPATSPSPSGASELKSSEAGANPLSLSAESSPGDDLSASGSVDARTNPPSLSATPCDGDLVSTLDDSVCADSRANLPSLGGCASEAGSAACTLPRRRGLEFNEAEFEFVADRSRHIPARVRRAVWIRDEGCCSFIGTDGHQCASRYQLEFDHWRAFSLGGEHTEENVRVLCARHNRFEAERVLGATLMRRFFDRPAHLSKTGARRAAEVEL